MTDLTPAALEAARAELADAGPIQMVNLLRYHVQADYGAETRFAPCSGRNAYYQRYIPAFGAIPGAEKSKIIWIGNVQATLVAPAGERWDDVAIVEYESFEAMRAIVESAQYAREAEPHRRAALQDWRFLAATKPGPG